jgi:SAM-dependent methyltransferase
VGHLGRDHLAQSVSPEGRVLAGPFAGLALPLDQGWGGLAARLSGSYEREVSEALLGLLATKPGLVVDVGCAEGYYAVGIARLLPTARVVAFDIDPRAQRACRTTARRNGVRNVVVRGRMTPRRLQRTLASGCVLICDCEGYEAKLLDPDATPVLREASIIVEVHEFAEPGVTDLVRRRFQATHAIRTITATQRVPEDYRHLGHLQLETARLAVDEGRPDAAGPMQWLVLIPLRPSSAA